METTFVNHKQATTMSTPFSLMFYNTENFYDTVNDPQTMDDEFTPEGAMQWDEKKFHNKAYKIAHVIAQIVAPDIPSVVGLAEIENKTVIEALLNELRKEKITTYGFIHYDSPDERGSDVALLYDTHTFSVYESHPILIHLPGIEDRTRDILHVVGKTKNDVQLHIFIIHFPSRREGIEKSERRRSAVAGELRNAIEKLQQSNPSAHIIVMGDFNDTPDNKSVTDALQAQNSFADIIPNQLYNLLYPKHQKGLGTTFHRGWLLFDQILVSGNLLLSDKIRFNAQDADIYNPRYLLHFGKRRIPTTNRTYRRHYTGGYSDHLPIYLKTELK